MDPSHFRGSQPPAFHVVPGAPGASGHHPHFGFMEPPPPLIPACSVGEILSMIRGEFASQNQLLNSHYINLRHDYNELKDGFRVSINQTDRILNEQYARFELKLDSIQEGFHQFHDGRMAAMNDLRARLDMLEGLTEASRNALTDRLEAVTETMGRGFNGLVAMIKSNEYGELLYLIYTSLNLSLTRVAAAQVPFPGQSGIPDNRSPEGALE